ncbi:hypothetical protein NL676_025770 [Syzygium grande]|nr:hypothetical protein NL676_025770 [Syzygium grande]
MTMEEVVGRGLPIAWEGNTMAGWPWRQVGGRSAAQTALTRLSPALASEVGGPCRGRSDDGLVWARPGG